MCRYNMSFNDAVMNELRPHFKDEESLLVWLEVNMDHLMREYIARFKKTNIDGEQLLRKLNTHSRAGLVLKMRQMVYSSKDFNVVDFCRDSAKYASIMAFAAPNVK